MSDYIINKFEHEIINTPNMPFYEFNNINTLCIKACMGIGKTNTLYDYLKYNMDKSIMIVSFRVSLEEKYLDDLPDFCIYNQLNGIIDSDVYPHLIIQIDSLHRIRGHYDIIIFDEITYTISHLITSCRTREFVYNCMTQLLEDENKIIFMDALMDNEVVDWISTFNNRKIKFIENKFTIHSDKKIISYKHDINNFIKEMKNSLMLNQRIVIASNNKTELLNIERIINKNFPYLRKLFITKETKNKYDITLWNNVDILAYTPTITAGISFTEKRFDKVFGLFCNSSSPADMSIQQLFRVRNVSTNEYHLCCKISGKKDYPLEDNDIDEYIVNNEKCLVAGLNGIKIDYIKGDIKKDKYYYLYKYIQKKIFMSCNNYNEYMIELLKTQGIKNIDYKCSFNKEETKKYNKEYREYRAEIRDLECEQTVSMPLITNEIAKELKNIYEKSNDEKLTLKKHNFLDLTKISNDILTKDIYKKFQNNTSQLYHLAYAYAFKDSILDTFNKRINVYEKNNINDETIKRIHRGKKLEKRIYVHDILRNIGFDDVFDNKEIDINQDDIFNYIINNKINLEYLFKTTKHDWNNIIKYDIKSFPKVMRYLNDRLFSILRVRVVLNKKTQKYYIKGLDFWDDESVTYKNPELLKHIKEKEHQFYEDDQINCLLNQILNSIN